MKNRKNIIVLLAAILLSAYPILAQKKVSFNELEFHNGLLYRINYTPPFSGVALDEYTPGVKREEVTFQDGKRHGKATGWDEEGNKIYEASFENNIQVGKETQWYPNSKKKAEVSFENGNLQGAAYEWYDSGDKKFEGTFDNGLQQGLHQWWFANGKKDQEIPYKDDLMEGTVKTWYDSGELKTETEYRQNMRNGISREYHKNGKIRFEQQYTNNKPNGDFKEFSKAGLLIQHDTYRDSTLITARNYRSASLKRTFGYLQVFNEADTYFTLKIQGREVKLINDGNVSFKADGKLIQLTTTAVKALTTNNTDPLNAQKELALAAAQKALGSNNLAPNTQTITLNKGKALYWHYATPATASSGARRVLEEHYMATVVGNQVLMAVSFVTNTDTPEQITELLKNTLNTLDIQSAPINLNTLK